MALWRNLVIGLIGCLSIGTAGCSLEQIVDPVDDGVLTAARWTGSRIRSIGYRQERDEPITLDVAALPVSIDVDSFGGNVTIDVDDDIDHAEVQVTRQGTHGKGRGKESFASLAQIDYTAEVVPGPLGQTLRVRTSTVHAEPHFQRAHVHIRVPAVDGVTVYTTNGKVDAFGIQGQVDISTSHGRVRVATNLPMRDPVSIVNKEGDIFYRVRGESAGRINCETIGGRVFSKIRYGRLALQSGTDGNRYVADLNDGTNPITLRNVDADIHVAVVHNPMHFGAVIVD